MVFPSRLVSTETVLTDLSVYPSRCYGGYIGVIISQICLVCTDLVL